jgi:hypothetical protein
MKDKQIAMQKLVMYGRKTGILANEKLAALRKSVNYEIEQLFLKISTILEGKELDVEKLEKKMRRMEEEIASRAKSASPGPAEKRPKSSEPVKLLRWKKRFRRRITKTKMCPRMLAKSSFDVPRRNYCCLERCDYEFRCPYAHTLLELELVPRDQKLSQVEHIIAYMERQNKLSEPPNFWVPNGVTEAILRRLVSFCTVFTVSCRSHRRVR